MRGVWFAKNPQGAWIIVGDATDEEIAVMEAADSHYIGYLDISYGWAW